VRQGGSEKNVLRICDRKQNGFSTCDLKSKWMSNVEHSLVAAMHECSWKSVLFFSDVILDSSPTNLSAIFARAVALFSQSHFSALESWMKSIPGCISSHPALLSIRCRGLESQRQYSQIVILLGGDGPNPLIPPLISIDAVERSSLLKPLRDRALFNLSKSEFRNRPPAPALTDPLSPSAIASDISSAFTKRDPRYVDKYATLCDSTSKTDSLLLTACGCVRYLRRCEDFGLAFLHKALELDSEFEICWLGLLFVLTETQQFDRGLITFKNAQRRFPQSEELPLFGVSLLLRGGFAHLAWPLLQQLRSSDPAVVHERGVAYLLDGELAEAAECFRAVLGGKVSDGLEGAAAVNFGHCLRRLGRFELAIETYNRALKCGTRPSVALAAIGFTYHLIGKVDDAILYYNRSLGVDERQPFATRMVDIALSGVERVSRNFLCI
jgi:anaphase-promoting complex subunit 6